MQTCVSIVSQNFAFSVLCKPCRLGSTSSNLDPHPWCERHGSILNLFFPFFFGGGGGSILNFTSQPALHSCFQRNFALQSSLWCKIENRPMHLTAWSWVQITASFDNFEHLCYPRSHFIIKKVRSSGWVNVNLKQSFWRLHSTGQSYFT